MSEVDDFDECWPDIKANVIQFVHDNALGIIRKMLDTTVSNYGKDIFTELLLEGEYANKFAECYSKYIDE